MEMKVNIVASYGMDFSLALKLLQGGSRVTREGWNGKGMWLKLQLPDANSKMSLPYIYMRTACGNNVPWLVSQTDLLANDWALYEDSGDE